MWLGWDEAGREMSGTTVSIFFPPVSADGEGEGTTSCCQSTSAAGSEEMAV